MLLEKFKKIGRLRLSEILSFLLRPSTLPTYFLSPRSDTIKSAIQFFFEGIGSEAIENYRLQFLRNRRFFEEVNEKMIRARSCRADFKDWVLLLYLFIRIKKPEMVVETGVFDGHSSAVILQALADNARGTLLSIDLPAQNTIVGSTHRMKNTVLPVNLQPGWLIPEYLCSRHRLLLGDSKELLPKVLKEYPKIDIFLHDSLHTFTHQWFEYTAAWPHIVPGGILLSDDVFWTSAFRKFCRKFRAPYRIFQGLGMAKKP